MVHKILYFIGGQFCTLLADTFCTLLADGARATYLILADSARMDTQQWLEANVFPSNQVHVMHWFFLRVSVVFSPAQTEVMVDHKDCVNPIDYNKQRRFSWPTCRNVRPYAFKDQKTERVSKACARPCSYKVHGCRFIGDRQWTSQGPTSVRKLSWTQSQKDDIKCAICTELAVNAQQTVCCGQTFCLDCITRTQVQRMPRCPLCRATDPKWIQSLAVPAVSASCCCLGRAGHCAVRRFST